MTDAPDSASVARKFGAPLLAAVPKVDIVQDIMPDPNRRAVLEKTRSRILLAGMGFIGLFVAVDLKLAIVTVLRPTLPKTHHAAQAQIPAAAPVIKAAAPIAPAAAAPVDTPRAHRAMITDRNGEVLALSLPTYTVIADPRIIINPVDAAHRLKSVLPTLDEAATVARLSERKQQCVYIQRQVTPHEADTVNHLGIPGVSLEIAEKRRYPQGRMAAQVLGGLNIDNHGSGGVEKRFDDRLNKDTTPLRLSLDVRVQSIVREELLAAQQQFRADAGAGIVMDVRTGEVLAMVSLPDFDMNNRQNTSEDERFDHAVGSLYEPGSTFKLQTVAMALDSGLVHLWNIFDATNNIEIGKFTIHDFEGKHRPLYVPEVIAYSSNIGAARMAETAGTANQRAWMEKVGMLARSGIELPDEARPLFPSAAHWKKTETYTVAYGQGINVTPLHVVVGTAAVANGGYKLHPTILAQQNDDLRSSAPRIMQPATSDTVRKLMRLVVTDGFGKSAEVPGYYVGGKTGTSEKLTGKGYNKEKTNVVAFTSVFPMNEPRYAVYMMLDHPHASEATHGYATAGWIVAPVAGKVIGRIGPILGLMPQTDPTVAAQIQASLAIPLQPGRPGGVASATAPAASPSAPSDDRARPPAALPPPTLHDLRHNAMYVPNQSGADHAGR